MERHREYYEKNKETIKERRRSYYHIKKEAKNRKVGKFEFAKISAYKNLAEIPDPYEPFGKVQINIPPPLPAVKALKKITTNKNSEEDLVIDEEMNDESCVKPSPLGSCLNEQGSNVKNSGDSKLRHDQNLDQEFITMPVNARLIPKTFDYSNVANVESFVGKSKIVF